MKCFIFCKIGDHGEIVTTFKSAFHQLENNISNIRKLHYHSFILLYNTVSIISTVFLKVVYMSTSSMHTKKSDWLVRVIKLQSPHDDGKQRVSST